MGDTKHLKKHQFKKGVVANPLGAGAKSKKDPIGTAVKLLTKQELVQVANIILRKDLAAIKEYSKTPGVSVLQLMVASVAAKIIREGNMDALDKLLNRLIGKVKDEVEHSGSITNPAQVIVTMPGNGREAKEDE